ncbi:MULTISPECIES: PTS sugar transporter subunit IIA [unclassified Enterococcus]|jgi:PTS system ascorbate-specific IIA component|uniref:PTS sugar transporter subunit IIA n=1 Tax=unclassified Enterococcus TaxID=2608891 RepID=UPI003D2E1B00
MVYLKNDGGEKVSRLKSWLPKKHIQVCEKAENWQEAVRQASTPLLEEQLITEKYIKNMIESVKEHGPYMVLNDYFALMHARPGEGVNQQCMSLFVVRQPVDMEGKLVKAFLILAAQDNQSHLESLQDIMTIFMDEEKYQEILTSDQEKLTEIFNGGESL